MNTNDHASKISDKTQIYPYRSDLMFTSNSASIDQKAQAIHHRTMLHAIHQNTRDVSKLVQENQILFSSFWCKIAINRGIDKPANNKTQKYTRDSEYVASNNLSILVSKK
ncbi:hypothetical protein IJL65_00315 [bacterium]|nr:hypothetical protein [bacterium]